MIISQWLEQTTTTFNDAGIFTARLDAELILSESLKHSRAWIHAHSDYSLQGLSLQRLNKLAKRRLAHEPIAYMFKHKEFYGRDFYVDKYVLVPRPESEQIIEQFLKIKIPVNAIVADIGCGSGVLGITAKLEKSDIQIHFIDIDTKALAITKRNARSHGIRGQYYHGNLISAWPIKYDVLLCNLPYVPKNFKINQAATYEPNVALFSGNDGLDLYRNLFNQLATDPRLGSPIVITESLNEQHNELRIIAQQYNYSLLEESELVQVFVQPDN